MADGGYDEPAYWSREGWAWRRANGVDRPWPWHLDQGGRYTWVGPNGWEPLEAESPVSGISYHEAQAFAAWAGGRLPHEHEWEASASEHGLGDVGTVWEWCTNPFAPYPGFSAFPYEGYSVPWFDGHHRVLRGGSRETDAGLKRPSFRNFFEPHVRHQFAGLRLAWTA
jgi:iron(II)-dependent oxidoreductase